MGSAFVDFIDVLGSASPDRIELELKSQRYIAEGPGFRIRGRGSARDYDGQSDRAAIEIGIELHRRSPGHVTADELKSRIVTSPLFTRPRDPQR